MQTFFHENPYRQQIANGHSCMVRVHTKPEYQMMTPDNRVFTIGKTKLGICLSEFGTRSIHSGEVMAMYLAGVPIFSIMLIGRWSSTAFLKCIRKQVQEISQCASP